VSITITIKYQHSLKMALKTFTTADGSANQALVTNGSGVLSFAAVGASAGQVIQVVTATDSTARNSNSTSFVTASNTLSVTITPSSASNKILVIVDGGGNASGDDNVLVSTIYRGATNLGESTGGLGSGVNGIDGVGALSGMFAMHILDSPSTTSATTYQVYAKNAGSGGTWYLNRNRTSGNSKSSITVMEIKG